MEALAAPTTSADTTVKSTKAVTSVIKTEAEYDLLLSEFMALVVLDLPADSTEDDRLELLGLLIQDYEEKHFQLDPSWAGDGVDTILYRMDQQGLTPKDLIPYLGSRSKVSEVLNRKRPLSLKMIRALHEGLGISADLLIR